MLRPSAASFEKKPGFSSAKEVCMEKQAGSSCGSIPPVPEKCSWKDCCDSKRVSDSGWNRQDDPDRKEDIKEQHLIRGSFPEKVL